MSAKVRECREMRERLPGYLDGAIRSREHARVREHLERCGECRAELECYRRLSSLMGRGESVAPPAGLALHIRLEVARRRARRPMLLRVRDRIQLFVENLLEPIALPATGGVMATLLVFVIVLHNLFAGVPLGAVPNDVPTNLIQPARLEYLAPFQLADDDYADPLEPRVLLVEAVVNAQGEAVSYDILSGPKSPEMRRRLDQVVMFSRFRPAMSFGRPVPGGRVVFNITEVRVRG